MRSKLQQFGLIALGVCLGVMISLNFSAVAQREVLGPLPVEELRAFTEVFGRIKSDYVETVEDKKLITEAITGMLAGLDPHSAYLDQDAFRELQVGTQGEFQKGDAVALCDAEGTVIARGLTNYSSADVERIKGIKSEKIAQVLGQRPYEEVIHRDNLAIVTK